MSSLSQTSANTAQYGFYAYTDTLKGVFYGPGCLDHALPAALERLGMKKVLVVTGSSLFHKTKLAQRVRSILESKDAFGSTFFGIGQHTPIDGIRRGIEEYKAHGCDGIVSLGGGSPIDASKAILYNLQKEFGGVTPSQIAIPTTLSAAEYSIGAGFTNDEGMKVAVSSPELAPATIILDAEVTLDTPERLWLSTGIRALDHAVESLYRPLVPHPVKVLCFAALADLFKYLPESKSEPKNVEIRQKLQIASWMSLWPLKLEKYSALGPSHALGHKLGAAYGIPHGITSCLTLAPIVKLMAKVGSSGDKQLLADTLFYLRQPSTGSVDGDVLRLSALIDKLVADLGLQSSLRDYSVPPSDFEKIAELTVGGRDAPLFDGVVGILHDING